MKRALCLVLVGMLAGRSARAQEVSASLLRRMDGAGDGIDFKYLRDGVVVSRSRQFVSDNQSPLVVGFVNGRAKRVGRIGSGPGEYRSPFRLTIKADSLMVMENPRVNRFAVESFAKGTTSVEQASSISGKPSAIMLVGTAGYFYHEAPGTADETVTGKPMSETIVWRDTKRSRSKTLATVTQTRGSSWVVPVLIDGKAANSAAFQPFVPRSIVAPSKIGNGVALLEQRTADIGNSALITVKYWDALGDAAGQCQWSETQQPLTNAIFDRVTLAQFDHPRIKVKRADVDKATVRPKLLPAFDLMVYASDGAIWLRTPSRYSSGVDRYLRVDRNCKSRVVVKFDATVTLFDAKDGTALVSYTDDETIEARLYAYKIPPQ